MPKYEIELGNGSKFEVEAPDPNLAANGLFEELYKAWSPDDLEMYKIKNRDAFSDFIIEKRAAPKDGETQAEYEKRRYGGRNTAGAAWSRSNPAAAGAANLLQGAPFVGEWTDEGIGAAAAALYGGDARQMADTIRGGREQFAVNNPKTATGLQLGGAAAGTIAALGAAPWSARASTSSLATRMLAGGGAGVVAGGIEGGVSGYGAGTDSASRAQMALDRAGTGAALGGVLGAAFPAVAAGVGRVARPISDAFTTSGPLRQMQLDRPAYEILERATAADEALVGPGAANISRGGPGAMVADAGPSTQSLLDTALQKSGPAVTVGRRRVQDRAAAAFGEVTNALDSTLGPYQAVETSTRVIREGTKGARRTAYDAAYNTPIDYSSNNGRMLQSLLWRVPKEAIDHANMLMRGEGLVSRQVMAQVAPSGRVIYKRLPDVRQLDYITRALGDWADIAQGKGKLGGMTHDAQVWSNLKTSIRNTLRQAAPSYGKALDTAASAIDAKNALQFGADMLRKMSRGEVAEGIRGASRAELTFMRSGVRAHVDDIIAKTKMAMTDPNMDARQAWAALKELSSPDARQKISMILGRAEADRLFKQLDQSATGIQLRANLAQNTKTMARQDMDETVRAVNQDTLAASIRRGEPGNILKRLWQAASGGRPIDDQMREDEIYSQIVEFLTGPRGPDAQQRLQLLRDVAANGPAGQAIANRIAKDIAAIGTASAYTAGVNARENSQGRQQQPVGLLN